MSADNWTRCPNCTKQAREQKEKHAQVLADAYGKVPREKYLALEKEANDRQLVQFEDTLREDYEIGIWNGEFTVSYGASCSVCNFKYEYKYEKKI